MVGKAGARTQTRCVTPEAGVLTTRSAIFLLVWPHHSKAPSAHLSLTVILGDRQGE